MPTFTLFLGADDKFYFNLKAANGAIICASQGYTTKQAALNGIQSIRENAPKAEISDETV